MLGSGELDPTGERGARVRALLAQAFERDGALGVLTNVGTSAAFAPPADAKDYDLAWTCVVYAMIVAAEEYVPSGRIGTDDFRAFLRGTWFAAPDPDRRANNLVALLAGPLRCYCAMYRGELDRDAIVPAIDSLVLRFEAALRKLARRLELPHESAALGALFDDRRMAATLGADLHRFAEHTLFAHGNGLRDKIVRAAARTGDYSVMNLNALVLLLLRLAATQP